jgi:hypothetical protein
MYLIFREPSLILLRSPEGIDPLSWLPDKSLWKQNTITVKTTFDANWVKLDRSCWTYKSVNEGNCERASGIEPIKLLFDKSLQDMKQDHFSSALLLYKKLQTMPN